ncbi:MAG: hypothetical protein KAK00_10040 [Nanoarchaeota archaeon]|nr:hypothetical protein [Nanoarchaeota archaeon]
MHHNNKILIWLVMFLILASISLGIGASPIRNIVDFEPNGEYELELIIWNDDHKDMKAIVYPEGELAEYIDVIDSLVPISNSESEKKVRYKLKLPARFDRPGVHKCDLVVMEYPSSFGTGDETMVRATASVVSELWLRVPFPGKYAEAELYADAKGVNEYVDFAIGLMNFGKDNIGKAKATIRILQRNNDEIAAVETNEISLKSRQQGKLTAKWLADVNPGKYHIIAEISYDEKKIVLERDIEIGNLFIRIKSITVKDFSLGEIAVFNILLESEWNEMIPMVYGEVFVLDNEGKEFTRFKTTPIDMPPMDEGSLKAYWDTDGVRVGTYTMRLLIYYSEKVTEKLIDTEVNIDSIRTGLGPTAQVVASKGMGRDAMIAALIVVLIAINIGWFMYFSKRRKKK